MSSDYVKDDLMMRCLESYFRIVNYDSKDTNYEITYFKKNMMELVEYIVREYYVFTKEK